MHLFDASSPAPADAAFDYGNDSAVNASADVEMDVADEADHSAEGEWTSRELRYGLVGSLLVVTCAAALLANAHVLAAVCWIRRPLSRTLRLSVSLAAADAFSSLCFGLGILLNSVLLHGFGIPTDPCVALVLEVLRLGAAVSAELHLLALAVHHLLGIWRPLQYLGEGNRRAAPAALAALWLLPTLFFAAYFASVPGQAFQNFSDGCPFEFMLYFKFRAVLSSILFTPLVGVFCIYLRIFALVRSMDASRPRHHGAGIALQLVAAGSGWSFRGANGTAQGRGLSDGDNRQQRVARHVKAARTTLLIVGSCVMGWAPAVVVYLLLCEDCPLGLQPQTRLMFFVYSTCNLLVILKTLLNPIIYALRMSEIKVAVRLMRQDCCCARVAARRRRSSPGVYSSTRAGTVVGYLRRSPLGDSGGGAGRGGGGVCRDVEGVTQPLAPMRRSQCSTRPQRLTACTENL